MEGEPEFGGVTVPKVHPGTDQTVPSQNKRPLFRRAIQVGVALGVASGVAVGAAALADAATSPTTPTTPSTKPATPPTPGHFKGRAGGFGGRSVGGIGFGGFGGFGQVLHGEATIKGPNGYETLEVQSGTVTSIKDVSGSTWSIVITSADKTAITYTVDSGSSVNGGETGISAVKTGDTVSIVAVVSKGTATAKTLIDGTRLKANGSSWMPPRQGPPSGSPTPTSGTSTS
jgi:hypothetical protein